MQSEKKVGGAVAPAQLEVLAACFATPEPGPRPGTPTLFTDPSAAEAHMDALMRDEWTANAPEDDEGEGREYPGGWQDAHDAMAAENDGRDAGDEMWGEHALTSHLVEVPLGVAVPRAAYDDLSRALANLLAARPLPQDLRRVPDAVIDATDAAEAQASRAKALQAVAPAAPRPDKVVIEISYAQWRAIQGLLESGLSTAAAKAASTANDGGAHAAAHRLALDAAMEATAQAGRAIAAMRPEATIAVWQEVRGWYYDDAEDHGGHDRISPAGPFRSEFEASQMARAAFPFKIDTITGRPAHYGEDAP